MKSNHHSPLPSESNHSEASSVRRPASMTRHLNTRRRVAVYTGPEGGGCVNLAMTEPLAKVVMIKQMTIRNHATTNRPSVTLSRLVSWTPEPPARTRVRDLPLLQYHLPIHEYVLDADRGLVRLLERRAIDHRRRVEHGDVGVHARPHEAAIGQADALRGERRHLAHRELQREQLQVPRIVSQDPRECAVGAGMRGLRAKWTVGRYAAEIGVHRHPPLLHRGL